MARKRTFQCRGCDEKFQIEAEWQQSCDTCSDDAWKKLCVSLVENAESRGLDGELVIQPEGMITWHGCLSRTGSPIEIARLDTDLSIDIIGRDDSVIDRLPKGATGKDVIDILVKKGLLTEEEELQPLDEWELHANTELYKLLSKHDKKLVVTDSVGELVWKSTGISVIRADSYTQIYGLNENGQLISHVAQPSADRVYASFCKHGVFKSQESCIAGPERSVIDETLYGILDNDMRSRVEMNSGRLYWTTFSTLVLRHADEQFNVYTPVGRALSQCMITSVTDARDLLEKYIKSLSPTTPQEAPMSEKNVPVSSEPNTLVKRVKKRAKAGQYGMEVRVVSDGLDETVDKIIAMMNPDTQFMANTPSGRRVITALILINMEAIPELSERFGLKLPDVVTELSDEVIDRGYAAVGYDIGGDLTNLIGILIKPLIESLTMIATNLKSAKES